MLLTTGGSTLLQSTMERVGCRGNTSDMDVQPFYNFIQRTYPWHVVASFAALYALGGLPALVRLDPVVWDTRLLRGAHMLQADIPESCNHYFDDAPTCGRLKLAFAKVLLVISVVTQNPLQICRYGVGRCGRCGCTTSRGLSTQRHTCGAVRASTLAISPATTGAHVLHHLGDLQPVC